MINPPSIFAALSDQYHVTVLIVSATAGDTITVYRQYDKDLEVVRGAQSVVMKADEQLFIDYEVPQGVRIRYWAVASKGSESAQSDEVVMGPYDFGGDVLFDLGDPKRGMVTNIEKFDQYKYGISRDVQRVWGRRDPVVISGVREMFTSTLNLLTLELSQRENLLDIIKNGSTVALSVQSPKYGLEGVLYFAIGDVTEARVGNAVASEPLRRWNLDVQQIAPPPAQYRYPTYGKTWREFRADTWRVQGQHEWWEAVAG